MAGFKSGFCAKPDQAKAVEITVSDACPKNDVRTWFLRDSGQAGQKNRTNDEFYEKDAETASRAFRRSLNSLKDKGKIIYDGQLVSLPGLRVS